MYKIEFLEEVNKDLQKLDNRVVILVFKKIKQLITNPEIGKPLGNKGNTKLSNLRKIYLDNKKIRIVYKIEEKKLLICIIAIGKREDFSVYKNADKRIDF